MRDELLSYYERELAYFRQLSGEFAGKYPKLAGQLQLNAETCTDPHVERLIEAFSFLTARIRLKLDDEFPEVTESLLGVLYPHYLAPIPAMSVIQMRLRPGHGTTSSGYLVERGKQVDTDSINGEICSFRTCFSAQLWPIEVVAVDLQSDGPLTLQGKMERATLRIKLRCENKTRLSALRIGKGETAEPIQSLRFHIFADAQVAFPLYETLLNQAEGVELVQTELSADQTMLPVPIRLGAETIRPVGFEEDEGMLPYQANSFPGYRLLTEYFTFPEKFLFVEFTGLDQAVAAGFGTEFEIRVRLRQVTPPPGGIDQSMLVPGCVPIVNLFDKRAEPVPLRHQQYEHHVIPDVYHRRSTEIYSINKVATAGSDRRASQEFSPIYSYKHQVGWHADQSYWVAVRRPSQLKDDSGTEMYLSMVDPNFDPSQSVNGTLNIWVTCTNRDLPAFLPNAGRDLTVHVRHTSDMVRARTLRKFTPTCRPQSRRGLHWRLISHLSLNHLSLVSTDETGTPHALREIMQLYDFTDSAAVRNQIAGLVRIASRRVVRQVGPMVGSGYIRGIETTLDFDESLFAGSGAFLFASVLDRFLGLYVSVNSFSQLVARSIQREGDICRWGPRSGSQQLL